MKASTTASSIEKGCVRQWRRNSNPDTCGQSYIWHSSPAWQCVNFLACVCVAWCLLHIP